MHFDDMTALIEREFDKIRSVRETKGREYAGEEDTLADFKEVAAEAGITPLQVWLTYVKKHQRAIDTYVREGAVKSEGIESRVMDVVVYHLLLLGLIKDLEPSGPVGVAVDDAREGEPVSVRLRSEDPSPHERMGPDPQCHSTFEPAPDVDTVRCSRPKDHPGAHQYGSLTW